MMRPPQNYSKMSYCKNNPQEILEEIKGISDDYEYDYAGGKLTLLQFVYEIVIAEFFQEFYSERVSVYEHRDAKIVYIPEAKFFNVIVYCSDAGASRDVSLKFEDALHKATGCETIDEAKKHLDMCDKDYAGLAVTMCYMITELLEVNACGMPSFDI